MNEVKVYITSKEIKKNFQVFIIYTPFNKCSKILESILFNKSITFTLPSIDNSQSDIVIILYNSMKISKKEDKYLEYIKFKNSCQSYLLPTKMSEKHIEEIAGGIKIKPRNLPFIKSDRNKNNFDDKNVDETDKNYINILLF